METILELELFWRFFQAISGVGVDLGTPRELVLIWRPFKAALGVDLEIILGSLGRRSCFGDTSRQLWEVNFDGEGEEEASATNNQQMCLSLNHILH